MDGNRETRQIPLDLVRRRPDQPRQEFDREELEKLATAIAAEGLRQPVTVRPLNGAFEIIMGERRWRAHQLLGLLTIEAFVETMGDQESYEAALSENLDRQDLNPLELGEAYRRLINEFGFTVQGITERYGVTAEHVNAHVEMLGARPDVLELVRRGQMQPGFARMLARLSLNGQARVLRAMIADKMTHDELVMFWNAVWAEENQAEMFSDAQPTLLEVEASKKVRSAIDAAVLAVAQLEKLDPDVAGEALAAEAAVLEQKVVYLQKGLNRALTIIRRRRVREYQQASLV